MKPLKFDGPIPGENYTSDTKNYPWHRPPDNSDYVAIVGKMVESMHDPEKASVALTALEDGDTILDFVTGVIRLAVSKGQIPIDQGILAAGPMAKMVDILATKAGIEYERGFNTEPTILTKTKVDAYRGSPSKAASKPKEAPVGEPPAQAEGGLMKPDEQDAMLGY